MAFKGNSVEAFLLYKHVIVNNIDSKVKELACELNCNIYEKREKKNCLRTHSIIRILYNFFKKNIFVDVLHLTEYYNSLSYSIYK